MKGPRGGEGGGVKNRMTLALAVLLLLLASQRLYTWPVPHAWEVGIGVTEWGYGVALAALFLGLFSRTQPAVRVISFVVAVITLIPCWQASYQDANFSWPLLLSGWLQTSAPAPETIEVPQGQPLDLYRPATPGPHPLVLVVHGGSWARGSRRDFAALNRVLVAQSYVVASLDYRLGPQHPYPSASEDLDRAYDYLLSRAGELAIDPQRVAWLGRSAGAHLALLEAYVRRPVRCVVAFYPPTDMLWSYEHPSNPSVLDSPQALRDFLGGTPEQCRDRYLEASPLTVVRAGAPATLLLHGQADDLVYIEQSLRLTRRLQELAVPWELHRYPWGNHGFDINPYGPSGQLSTRAVGSFLARYLR